MMATTYVSCVAAAFCTVVTADAAKSHKRVIALDVMGDDAALEAVLGNRGRYQECKMPAQHFQQGELSELKPPQLQEAPWYPQFSSLAESRERSIDGSK